MTDNCKLDFNHEHLQNNFQLVLYENLKIEKQDESIIEFVEEYHHLIQNKLQLCNSLYLLLKKDSLS